ncbi:hypothetical protein AAVH_29278 [Aphelenchoides avenae]|nr:hypothetical protein AAVH_29278 [Aphelenchus avenae]
MSSSDERSDSQHPSMAKKIKRGLRNAKDVIKERAHDFKKGTKDKAHEVKEDSKYMAHDFKKAVKETAHDAKEQLKNPESGDEALPVEMNPWSL